MLISQLRKEFIYYIRRNLGFRIFSLKNISTKHNSKFKPSSKTNYNKGSNNLENFTYKIDEFIPSKSKYSLSEKTQPEQDQSSPTIRVPKYIENNDYYNKFVKGSKNEESSTDSKTKGIIPLKYLKPGRKSTIPIKSFQKKMNKEDRLKHRMELVKREERKKVSYEEKKLLQNQETAISRMDLNYISEEKQKIKDLVNKIRQEKSIEKKRIFNTENLRDFEKEERLSKRLARLGVSSRRQAERMIKTGMVKIDGQEVKQNISVDDETNIQIYSKNGFRTPIAESTRIWLFYKPVGVICTTDNEKVNRIF
jgi:ribosomal protein S4